jgi:hypothetical protein
VEVVSLFQEKEKRSSYVTYLESSMSIQNLTLYCKLSRESVHWGRFKCSSAQIIAEPRLVALSSLVRRVTHTLNCGLKQGYATGKNYDVAWLIQIELSLSRSEDQHHLIKMTGNS